MEIQQVSGRGLEGTAPGFRRNFPYRWRVVQSRGAGIGGKANTRINRRLYVVTLLKAIPLAESRNLS